MKKLLVVGVVIVQGMGSAVAANLPVKVPLHDVTRVPAFGWTGCYVGGNLGAVAGADHYDFAMAGQFLSPFNIFSNPANNAQLAHSYRSSNFGVAAGVQLGCNYQIASKFVVGIEGDINGSSLRESINATYGPAGPFGVGAILASSHSETVSKDLRWFSTIRGRAGFTWDRLFLYGTAGLAVAEFASSTNVTFGNDQFFLSGSVFQGSASQTRTGWVAGLGAEWALRNNWSLKGEWLHLDVGNLSYTNICVNLAPGCGGPGPGPKGAWSTNVRLNEEIFRIGANYKFR